MKRNTKAGTHAEYLATLDDEKRTALEKLSRAIRAIAPKAEECISYGLPAFRLDGKVLVLIGATAGHCAFYPGSGTAAEAHRDDLKAFNTSKGTIRFQPDKPLPTVLVRKLVKYRIAENNGRREEAKKRRPAVRRQVARTEPGRSQLDPAVTRFLRELDHPLKQEIEAVRNIILGVSPDIREGIKWNAPSFRTTDYFATLNNPRVKDRVMLILHKGAKVKDDSTKGMQIADPAGLLKWLAKERCLVTFADMKDIHVKRAGLESIIREWIAQV